MLKGRGSYRYNSKIVREGILDRVKTLRIDGKSYSEIAKECGLRNRQQAYEIYQRSIAKGY